MEWLVRDIINEKSLAVVYGEGRSKKSFLAFDMGLSIVAGLNDWHGYQIQKKGDVVYVSNEGKNGFEKRIAAWEQHHNIKFDKDANFYIFNDVDQLFTDEDNNQILIIIDTLLYKNDVRMSDFINVSKRLMDRYGCAVIIFRNNELGEWSGDDFDWEYVMEKMKLHCRKSITKHQPADIVFIPQIVTINGSDETSIVLRLQ